MSKNFWILHTLCLSMCLKSELFGKQVFIECLKFILAWISDCTSNLKFRQFQRQKLKCTLQNNLKSKSDYIFVFNVKFELITQWVIFYCCKQSLTWLYHPSNHPSIHLSIHLSIIDLHYIIILYGGQVELYHKQFITYTYNAVKAQVLQQS